MKVFIFSFCLLFIGSLISHAQSNLSIGAWKSYLSYKEGKVVTQNKEKVIYASGKGLFTIDKEDLSVKFLSKEDGLTDINIAQLYYDISNDQLIIIYSDNNIDILKGDEVINIPFIKSNTSIIGSKTINDAFIVQGEVIYFATDFGILGFNLRKLEFIFTTFTDLKVKSVAYLNGFLYAGTEEGLFRVNVNTSNVSDFSIWESLSSRFPPSFEVNSLSVKDGNLYALVNNKVYKMNDNSEFSIIFSPASTKENIKFISEEGRFIMAGIEDDKNRSRLIFIDNQGVITEGLNDCINRVVDAIEDEKGRIWYADEWDPVRYSESGISGCNKLVFSVPFANSAGEVSFKNNEVFIASGGVTEDYQYNNTANGFYTLNNKSWQNYNRDNIPLMGQKEFINVQAIAPHPLNKSIYVGSYWNGLLQYNPETQEAIHFNKDNSLLQGVTGDEARTRITSLVFDKEENLWISNFGAPKPLVVRSSDNSWFSFSVPGSTNLGDIIIDQQGNKWVAVVGVGNGLVVFNEGADLNQKGDDKIRYITKSNSDITGNKVNCLVSDLDGSVWVGTDQGPIVFDCGDPFKDICRGNIRKVVVDGIPAYLLKDEDILSIEIDGGNRKWFGTRNGIFVQSSDGTKQEMKFDVKNSPLLNNKVTDLSYNSKSGEMFITTSGGIQSYKTETTEGQKTHGSNVYAFPNPVRPDYSGPIAIKGLVRDANVKITDINGKLVFETTALGGQAIWDGKDYNGVRASTGVYLVFTASENTSLASDAYVTKILFIN